MLLVGRGEVGILGLYIRIKVTKLKYRVSEGVSLSGLAFLDGILTSVQYPQGEE